ncbi:hypothetical protein [Nonomuraea sp. KM90]|uniref:hypothetical protein n=1 Tax=Nonomuraea sp. KM90 TaxID=3457428 RepID=UPI003FCD2431
MTSPPVTVTAAAAAVEAARLMDTHDVKRRTEAAVAVRMAGRVNGVVDVVDELSRKRDDSKWEGM